MAMRNGSYKYMAMKNGNYEYRGMKNGNRLMRGSMTVEMSFLMPMILFLIMGCILTVFYYHDKTILAGAAYETVVVGSTKMREKEPPEEGELKELFRERVNGKCILFSGCDAVISISDQKIEINVTAAKGRKKVSVVKRAAVTEPEKYIRNYRRIKRLGNGTENND